MSELFDKWEDDIKKYCEINNLSFEKAKNMAKCWEKMIWFYNIMIVQKIMGKGLNDEIPLPIVLKIKKKDNVLIFEQTEYTNKYLSKINYYQFFEF